MERSRATLGNVVLALGYVWAALFVASLFVSAPGVLGDALELVARTGFIFPIVLLFIGRALRRGASSGDQPVPPLSQRQSRPARRPPASGPRPPALRTERPSTSPPPEPRPSPELEADLEAERLLAAVEDLVERSGEFEPRSSDEMIAEARRRWGARPEA